MNKINSEQLSNYFLASPFFSETQGDRTAFIQFFSKLPQPIKDFLTSPETAGYIYKLGKDYQLRNRQVSIVAKIVRDVVVGHLFIRESPQTLASLAEIEAPLATEILNKIIAELFPPIIQFVKQAQRENFSELIKKPAAADNPQNINQNNVVDLRNNPQ